ncbi:hypothetical protein PISMIDRAFT_689160 [Pisolithus microcarpus 441]|uniref:Uncharacterized protein n=1 Tax=Pisolithus microcarpus 441 TaxID=765257 RepID=A0A0C9XKH3_9AGAM|nr:hypothetical protein PISMIDRAFT_689160 [Pisolithus microcarpus 441]
MTLVVARSLWKCCVAIYLNQRSDDGNRLHSRFYRHKGTMRDNNEAFIIFDRI